MLPFPVELHDDEILISYLSRLARKNGLPGVRDLTADFEIDWTSCLAGTEATLQQLASLTAVPPDRFAASAFRKTPDSQIALSGETLNDSRIMRGQFRVCPACLREDMGGKLDEAAFLQMYARKLWALKAARVCPTHRLHLVPPPEPGVMHEFCSSWEPWLFELVEGELDRPTKGRGLFEAFAEARFSGTAPRLGWADSLPLCALGVASEVLGRTGGTLDDPEAAAQDTDTGFGLLSAGVTAIVDEFDRRRVQQGQPQARPQGRYGPIHDWLKRGAGAASEFAPLRDILRTHIENTWPLGPGDLLLDGVAEERRYHSVLSAAAQYDMRPARVRRLLDDAGLVAMREDRIRPL